MLLFILAYVGGVLTIVSPCILPVLPFVFTRAGQPFARSGLPMLLGMAASFALVATLAAAVGDWVATANQVGRWLAMALLALFGAALLWPGLAPRFAARLTAPATRLGVRLSERADTSIGGSVLLGVATGLLWAPCAGPVLGLVLSGAALSGPSAQTSVLLLAYAAGAATALSLALRAGNKVLTLMRRGLGISGAFKRGLGALVLAAVGAIALGLDTGFLTQLSLASTNAIEERLIASLQPAGLPPTTTPPAMMMAADVNNPAMMMAADPNSNPAMMMAPASAETSAAPPRFPSKPSPRPWKGSLTGLTAPRWRSPICKAKWC